LLKTVWDKNLRAATSLPRVKLFYRMCTVVQLPSSNSNMGLGLKFIDAVAKIALTCAQASTRFSSGFINDKSPVLQQAVTRETVVRASAIKKRI